MKNKQKRSAAQRAQNKIRDNTIQQHQQNKKVTKKTKKKKVQKQVTKTQKKSTSSSNKKSIYSKYCSDTDEDDKNYNKKTSSKIDVDDDDEYDDYYDIDNSQETLSNSDKLSDTSSSILLDETIEQDETDIDEINNLTQESNDIDLIQIDEQEEQIADLVIPNSSNDLLIEKDYLLDCLSVYEILRHFSSILRLSPFIFEDFCACLMTNENNSLYSEIHVSLIKILLKEDELNQIYFGSSDVKTAIDVSFFLIDSFTWPELLKQYIQSDIQLIKKDPKLIQILNKQDYPLVSIDDKLYVLNALCNLFLSTSFIKNELLNEGNIQSDDHCRVCHKLGNLLCCETCPATYHLNCIDPPLDKIPDDDWICSICKKHQIKGVYDCLNDIEKNGFLIRQDPLGYDRYRRKYWFICRRIIVEDTQFKCTSYYSTKLQLDLLLKKLDSEKYEVKLVKNIRNKYDLIVTSMKITQELTDERKFMKKSYLDDLNEQLMQEQIQDEKDNHKEILNENEQLDGIVDNETVQQPSKLVKILKLDTSSAQLPSINLQTQSTSLLKKLVNGDNYDSENNKNQSVIINDDRFKFANIINTTKKVINLNLVKNQLPSIQMQTSNKDSNNIVNFVNNLKPLINIEEPIQSNKCQQQQQQQQVVLYKLGMESNYRLYENQYSINPLTMNRNQHGSERDRKNILSRRFFVNVDFNWKNNIFSNQIHLAKCLSQTILHVESLISPAFMHHLWNKYRDKWISKVQQCKSIKDFCQVLLRFESVMKPFLFIGSWRDGIGYVKLLKESQSDKEERKKEGKRHVVPHLSSYQSYLADNPDLPQTYARFSRGLKHAIYRQKGEEYRLSGTGGWYWHSSTRKSKAKQTPKYILTEEDKLKYQQITKRQEPIPSPNEPWYDVSLHPYLQSISDTPIDIQSAINSHNLYPKKLKFESKLDRLLERRLKAQEEILNKIEKTINSIKEKLIDNQIEDLNKNQENLYDKNDPLVRTKIYQKINEEKLLDKLIKQTDKGDYVITIKGETIKIPSNPHTSKIFKLRSNESLESKKVLFPPLPKFSINEKTSIFLLSRYQIRSLARKGGIKADVSGFKVENYKQTPAWPYLCGRPVIRTSWLYKTYKASNLSSLALQLRYLWTCIRWDAINERPPTTSLTYSNTSGEAILTETFDDCVQTTELIKRRDLGDYNLRSEYLIRKKRTSLIPNKTLKTKKSKIIEESINQEQRTSARRSSRQIKKTSFIEDSDSDEYEASLKSDDMSRGSSSSTEEVWVSEDYLHLWQVKGFYERSKRIEQEQLKAQERVIKQQQPIVLQSTPRIAHQQHQQQVIINPNIQNLTSIRQQTINPIVRTSVSQTSPLVVTKILQTGQNTPSSFQVIRTPINLSTLKVITPTQGNGKIIRLINTTTQSTPNLPQQFTTNIRTTTLPSSISTTTPVRQSPKSVAQLLTQRQSQSLQSPNIHFISQEINNEIIASPSAEEIIVKPKRKPRKSKITQIESLSNEVSQALERKKQQDLLEKHKEMLRTVINKKKDSIYHDISESIKHNMDVDEYIEWKKAGFPIREAKIEQKIELLPLEPLKIELSQESVSETEVIPDTIKIEESTKTEEKIEELVEQEINIEMEHEEEDKKEERPSRKRKLSVKLNDSIVTDAPIVPPLKIKISKIDTKQSEEQEDNLQNEKRTKRGRKKSDQVQQLQLQSKSDLYCLCKRPYNNRLFYIGCDKCQDWFHGSCVGILPMEASTLETYKCPNCLKNEGKEWLLEREITSKNYEFFKTTISQIKAHRMAWPFITPVDSNEVPNYYEIIKEPMDLTKIESRLNNNEYKTYIQLIHDFSKILENCRLFNPVDSKFCKCADACERLFMDKLKLLKSKL